MLKWYCLTVLGLAVGWGFGEVSWRIVQFSQDRVPLKTKREIRALSDEKLAALSEQLSGIGRDATWDEKRDVTAIWSFARQEMERRASSPEQKKETEQTLRNEALDVVRTAAESASD